LRDVAPNARLIALLMNPENLNYEVDVRAAEDAARGLDRQTFVVRAKSPAEIDAAFDAIRQKHGDAVLIASDPMFLGQRERLASLSAKYRLPLVAWTREFPHAGILLSYGTSIVWMYREAGLYAARILRGARPAELPIIQPTSFELVVNLRTANALGLTIPQSVLVRADEVIQ
jgi:putative ABC transport system substrate-binding protein